MENPAEEIIRIMQTLTHGSPLGQKQAVEAYFLPNASFEHPFCRVPSFSKFYIYPIGEIDSRWAIWMAYRWYRILVPRLTRNVHCLVFDRNRQVLYFSVTQVIHVYFIPIYRPTVKFSTVMFLSRNKEDGKYYIESQQDLFQINELLKFFWPGGALMLVSWQLLNAFLAVIGALVLAPGIWVEEAAARNTIQ